MSRHPRRSDSFFFIVWLLLVGAGVLPAAETDEPGKVTLPLADYLSLVSRADAADEAREEDPEEAFAELVSQRTFVRIHDDLAHLTTIFEVRVAGATEELALLPLAGWARSAVVEPSTGASILWEKSGEENGDSTLCLAATEPGTYRIEVEGSRRLGEDAEGQILRLPPSPAAVASLEVELPADLSWSVEGAVVVSETAVAESRAVVVSDSVVERQTASVGKAGSVIKAGTSGEGLRRLSLAPERDVPQELRLSRVREGGEAARTLARASVVTLVELSEEGSRRHDLVQVDVLRGDLGRVEVELPEGLSPERVGTDEGEVLVSRQGRTLVVPREKQLSGSGYLYLTATETLGDVPLDPIDLSVPVRSRYLVTTASAAVEAVPLPEVAWKRVDLDDLPPELKESLRAAQVGAAWRRTDTPALQPVLSLQPLPTAAKSETLIAQRETFTLLTVDGSLVHRETFDVRRGRGALELELPPETVIWSVSVDGVAVRPVTQDGDGQGESGGGEHLAVPLGFSSLDSALVEVVAVQERTVPKGRSSIGMELLRVDLPVLEHRWSLLLPEGRRYRYAHSALQPAQPPELGKFVESLERRSSVVLKDTSDASRRGTSGVRGVVRAEDGSELPGVEVKVSSPSSGQSRTTLTDEEGGFSIRDLAAGSYRLETSSPGFNDEEQQLRLRPDRTSLVDVTLSLAAVRETIVVTAGSPASGPVNRREWKQEIAAHNLYHSQVVGLQQGLVGGVKPLQVEIPETGKGLFLAGALPPRVVTLELDVKGGR